MIEKLDRWSETSEDQKVAELENKKYLETSLKYPHNQTQFRNGFVETENGLLTLRGWVSLV